ncbi:MAG: hypothetical protein J6V70_04465, partial [Kiritimatiellae bacterium]|nr:hypothetical protein [Kiritimatiellia bacterium]
MKLLVFLLLLATQFVFADVYPLKNLPTPQFVDGEVSTNVCINLSDTTNKTQFKIDIEFTSNISNEVQVL